ncbi:MAG: hypothetical protein WB821_09915 [Burkholderiaceae bacterium]
MQTSLTQRLTIIGLFTVLVTSTSLLACANRCMETPSAANSTNLKGTLHKSQGSSTAHQETHDPVGHALRIQMFGALRCAVKTA